MKKRFDEFLEPAPKPRSLSKVSTKQIAFIAAAVVVILLGAWGSLSLINGEPPRETSEATQSSLITPAITAEPTTPAAPSPTTAATSTATTAPSATPTEPASTPTPTGTSTATPTREATPTISPTGTPSDSLTAVCICSPMNAALYSEPDSDSAQIGVFITQGEHVEVLGRADGASWILVKTEDGHEGWADVNRFELTVPFNAIPVVATIVTISTSSVESDLPLVAYWFEIESSRRPISGGRWEVTLSLQVPGGGNYSFAMTGLTVTFKRDTKPSEGGYDFYLVTISGVGCNGSLVDNLIVTRNGQPLTVENYFTHQQGAIYVSPPSC